jgi:hypothetical protein
MAHHQVKDLRASDPNIWLRPERLDLDFSELVAICGRMARPKLQIDSEDIQNLAAVGCSVEEIAALITPDERVIEGKFINHKTIERRFGPTLKKGRAMMKGQLRSRLFERAMAGDTAILIFLAKTILGLRELKETPDVNVSVKAAASVASVADTRSQEQIKAELVELQRAIRDEANRFSTN